MATPRAFLLMAVTVSLVAACLPLPAQAQDGPTVDERLRKLEDENAALRALLEKLSAQMETLQPASGTEAEPTGDDADLPDVDALLEETQPGAAESGPATGDAGGDPDLNPLIAFTFDFAAKGLDRQPDLYDTGEAGRSPVLGLRSVELTAKRGISAYADGFVTFGDHGHGPELEEAYADINRLLPRANLRIGKWRVPFGPYNGVHEHQLPFLNPPRSQANFFGAHGCSGEGAEVSYIAPTRDFLELRAGAYSELGSESDFVFAEDPGSRYGWSGRARYNRPLTDDTDLDLSVSYLDGPNDDGADTRTGMLNGAFQLRRDQGNQRSDRLIVEWTQMDRDTALGSLERDGWSAAYLRQAGMYWDWGLLVEDAEFGDPGLNGRARGYNAFATWKAQETQWFRLQYRHGTYPTGDASNELMFQSIWSIGSHSHEFQ